MIALIINTCDLFYVLYMKILDFIFPKKCVGCGKTGEYLCQDCKRTLQPHMEVCPCCHRYSKDYQTCVDCKSLWNFVLDWILIPFSYSWFLKKIVLKLKYYHKRDVVSFLIDRVCFAIYANHTLNSKIGKWNVIVSWIPSHRYRRYFVKWYNQSFLLAKDLAKKLNVPYADFLKKNKKTKSQASLDRNWRLNNLKNAFSFKDVNSLMGVNTLILVDDVTTTWSTMNEVAKLVKSQYPDICIRWVVLCRKDR